MAINKHGLRRTIPAAVKSLVRKRCGFGCVMCGAIPYEYDHFIVPWVDAREHNADDIILLCDTHHKHKTSGLLDTSSIRAAINLRSSENSEFRFKLSATSQDFKIHWPHNKIEASMQGIVVDSVPILKIDTQENPLEPVVMSGSFSNLAGKPICLIEDNEIVSRSNLVGDFSLIKNRFVYKETGGSKSLQFSLSPRGIDIENIFHIKGDAFVRSTDEYLVVGNISSVVRFKDMKVIDCEVAIGVQSSSDSWDFNSYDITKSPDANQLVGISMVGGHTGVFVGAPARYRPSFSFSWYAPSEEKARHTDRGAGWQALH